MQTGIRKPISVIAAALLALGVLALVVTPAKAVDKAIPVFVTGAGPGAGAHVRAFRADGGLGTQLASFNAYGDAFRGGVDVVLADLDGDGAPEIITGAGPGGGPHVRAFELNGTPINAVSFAALPPTFSGGVHVGAADVDGDGDDEVVVGAGSGGNPTLRVFDFDPDTLAPAQVCEATAYGATFRGGLYATGIWLDPEATEQAIVTSAGPGGGAHVRVFNGNCTPHSTLGNGFNAYPVPGYTGGANVDTADMNADGTDEIVTIALRGSGHVRSFTPVGGVSPGSVYNFAAYPNSPNLVGNDIGALFPNQDAEDEGIVTGAGSGAGAHVRSFNASGGVGPISFGAYPNFFGGVHVAGGYVIEDVPPVTTTTTSTSTSTPAT